MVEETIEIDLGEQSLPNLIIYCHHLLKYDNRLKTIAVRISKEKTLKKIARVVCVCVCVKEERITRARKHSILCVLSFLICQLLFKMIGRTFS